ncbi:uncharacterized protein LOC110029343 isoform X2 [Phalaenopsis equestris]|uniref:uncharacterized protein LOC110029343 isoform X2 n=1 Tax=Phalaenopsis equestris TaxID=78828 RepID=UPI0009E5C8BB|nr:uncharacterized protein LOC110029343 isoform X2 [Phalaenopsis equestris]
MASSDCPSPSPRRRSLRRLLLLKSSSSLAVDHNHLMSPSLSSPPSANSGVGKKKAFGSSAFCGLGCAFSDDSSVHSSENSDDKGSKRRITKKIKKETRGEPISSISSVSSDESAGSDSHGAERALSGRPFSWRRGGNLELRYSVEDSFSPFQAAVLGSDPIPPWRYHRLRGCYHHRPVEIEQMMNFHLRVGSGRGDAYDRHSDWRLDVDNMTYEDLLELGDKIGYVSTGLREEQIASCIIKLKPSIFDIHISTEKERKCSVCQEEYEIDDEVGKLGCDHSFHLECIKKWLLQKNACPVCKAAVKKS